MNIKDKKEIFRQSVALHFSEFKKSKSLLEAYTKAIDITDQGKEEIKGYLVPVCELHLKDFELIEMLTIWRNENKSAYPSQFTATSNSTLTWLQDRILKVDDRILFLVTNQFGEVIGHLGFANAFSGLSSDRCNLEIDNVIRGIEKNPGLMGLALNSLISWAQQKLMPDQIFLRVFADNDHAIAFYEKNSFLKDDLLPLNKDVRTDGTYFSAAQKGKEVAAHFLKMHFSPKPETVGHKLILTAGPSISALECWYAYDAAKTGWNSKWNGYLKEFEKKFAEYVGTKYAISTSSCTGALHLSLLAMGIGPGDEVVVPDLTWVATANAVTYTGATPIFADVDPNTWCLDPNSAESKITSKTKAIIPVHLYGHPADMDAILSLAQKYKLKVLEDAAPSIGATFKNRKTGSFGDIAAFSFQGAKLTVSGEGGMIVTNDPALYEKALSLWDQGRDPLKAFWINDIGWKYKMSNIQAAVGLAQLERAEELIAAKRRIFQWYEENLRGLNSIKLCKEPANTRSIYWMSSFQLLQTAKVSRDQLREELKKRNIDTRPVFPAISQYPIWKVKQSPLSIAKQIGDTSINLPSGGLLKKEEVDYISKQIIDLLK